MGDGVRWVKWVGVGCIELRDRGSVDCRHVWIKGVGSSGVYIKGFGFIAFYVNCLSIISIAQENYLVHNVFTSHFISCCSRFDSASHPPFSTPVI